MPSQELNTIKYFLDSYLAKSFIQANLAFYSLLVFFIMKLSRGIQFYINYQRLNIITKKRLLIHIIY